MNVERMEKALHEVWKYYDEAGETGQNYVLDPDNLTKFAADLCKEYQNLDEIFSPQTRYFNAGLGRLTLPWLKPRECQNHKRGPDYTRKPVEHSE